MGGVVLWGGALGAMPLVGLFFCCGHGLFPLRLMFPCDHKTSLRCPWWYGMFRCCKGARGWGGAVGGGAGCHAPGGFVLFAPGVIWLKNWIRLMDSL